MYSISVLWTDNFENDPAEALGYRLEGFTSDESLAETVRAETPIISKHRCWAMTQDMPLYVVKVYDELTLDSPQLDMIPKVHSRGRTTAP